MERIVWRIKGLTAGRRMMIIEKGLRKSDLSYMNEYRKSRLDASVELSGIAKSYFYF